MLTGLKTPVFWLHLSLYHRDYRTGNPSPTSGKKASMLESSISKAWGSPGPHLHLPNAELFDGSSLSGSPKRPRSPRGSSTSHSLFVCFLHLDGRMLFQTESVRPWVMNFGLTPRNANTSSATAATGATGELPITPATFETAATTSRSCHRRSRVILDFRNRGP